MRSILTSAAALAVAVLSASAGFFPAHAVERKTSSEAARAAALISAYRVSQGLPPVTVDPRLTQAAVHQAREVAASGSLSHGDFSGRMRLYGIRGYAAENLSAGVSRVEEAVAQWQASPAHNQNLLLPQARRIGLARVDVHGGYGRYWALVLSQ